jgi:catalase-peroxidase
MFTTDLALKFDPQYRAIAENFHKNPEAFQMAFAKAWFKLTHRDMGPKTRYLGSMVPSDDLIWQDPIPATHHPLVNANDIAALKAKINASGLSSAQLVRTAWAAASTFRGTDKRGGANGARIRLAPQKDWAVNNPKELSTVLTKLESIQSTFNQAQKDGKQISLADLIVLAGDTAIEQSAQRAGIKVSVPFTPGRNDASQAQTDVQSFQVLEPVADGFRNYYSAKASVSPTVALVDKSAMLNLTVPEMTALIGGLRVLNANADGQSTGVFTTRVGTLSNDFFVNLLDMSTKWTKSTTQDGLYEGHDRKTNQLKWTASSVDLAFGSNSELRAVAEVYASSDGQSRFIKEFVKAWNKVMNADRFDVKH